MKYIACMVFILSTAHASFRPHNFTSTIMACDFRIVIYHQSQQQARSAADKAFARIAEIESICSDYQSHSEVSLLSETFNQWTILSDDLWAILHYAQNLSHQSQGAFDVSCGPLSVQWRMARFQKKLPNNKVIARSLERCGYKNILLDSSTQSLKLLQANMKIDLGAIAKGYAADEAMKVLQQAQIDHAMIDAGGDLLMSTHPHDKWKVYLSQNEYIEIVRGAVASSGNSNQKLTLNEKVYSHIIDPRTGHAITYNQRVSVYAPTAMQADALASTLSVLKAPERLIFLNKKNNFSAVIYNDKQTFKTKQFPLIYKD